MPENPGVNDFSFTRTHVCMHACMHACMLACMYVRTYVCACLYVYSGCVFASLGRISGPPSPATTPPRGGAGWILSAAPSRPTAHPPKWAGAGFKLLQSYENNINHRKINTNQYIRTPKSTNR